jgi:energy-coupling factor transporter ATP-binding protein EcfA2
MKHKRITLFAGHYGSGKTNIAVNYAQLLAGEQKKVQIADLDIVNPYFRTKDSERELSEYGIKLISSNYANSNVDIPALPPEMYSIICDKSYYSIIDVGGDDRGALALGRLAPSILEENDYEMIFVVNFYRPLTQTPQDTLEVMGEIENACKMKFTSIANNSNLGAETTAQTVLDTDEKIKELLALSGLKLKMTTATEAICKELEGKIPDLLPIKLQKKYY